jgi:hypothetical protein
MDAAGDAGVGAAWEQYDVKFGDSASSKPLNSTAVKSQLGLTALAAAPHTYVT